MDTSPVEQILAIAYRLFIYIHINIFIQTIVIHWNLINFKTLIFGCIGNLINILKTVRNVIWKLLP